MDIKNIPIKQDKNPVKDSTTQVSAEEFNSIVDTVKNAVVNKLGTTSRNDELYITHKLAGGTDVLETSIPKATTSTPGIMSKDDKDKLDKLSPETYLTKEELGDIGTTAQEAKNIAEQASRDVAAQESTIADIQETIENISAGGGATNAASVTYNSAGGSLTSTNVQNALTEVAGRLDGLDTANSEAVKDSEISEVRHIVNGVEYKTIVPSGETNNMDFVAPTEAGTQGHILQSSGDKNTPPTWADPADFKVGSASSADNAAKLGGVEASKYVKKTDLTEATTSKAGLMSAADKTKLDNLSEGGENPLEGYNLVSMTVNGDSFNVLSDSNEAPTIYTPTEEGWENAVLMADEDGMPYWADQTDLHVGSADSATNATNATKASSATKATSDGNGNNIVSTYATKTALNEVKGLVGGRDATSERMGYVILDSNKTFAEQVTKENTIYEIRDEFSLGRISYASYFTSSFTHTVKHTSVNEEGETIEITENIEYLVTGNTFSVKYGDIIRVKYPFVLFDSSKTHNLGLSYTVDETSGKSFYVAVPKDKGYVNGSSCEYTTETPVAIPKKCILKFEGGSLSNGAIKIGNVGSYNYDTLEIVAPAYHIFKDNLEIIGEFTSDRISIEWFGAIGDGKTDCTDAIRYAIKSCNNKGYALHLGINKTYLINGTLNEYDGACHDVKRISFVGSTGITESYIHEVTENKPSALYIAGRNISLFKDATISMQINGISVQGYWADHVGYKNVFFHNCLVDGLIISNCRILYLYAMFLNSGVWGVSRINNNKFLGIYNFSCFENAPDDNDYISFVDSSIYNNYINGGANNNKDNEGNYIHPVIDNTFFAWEVVNGASIYDNFIDYYRIMYGTCEHYNINSAHNHYQVFYQFHGNCNIISDNDYFNWNDENHEKIKDVMGRYKKNTYTGEDGISYEEPCYIASDKFYNRDIVFKSLTIEKRTKNVIYRTGPNADAASSGSFIIETNDNGADLSNSIVYKQGTFPVRIKPPMSYKLHIDKSFAHKLSALPTDWTSGDGRGKYGLGEWILVNGVYYVFKAVYNGGNIAGWDIVPNYDYSHSSHYFTAKNIYIFGGKITLTSDVSNLATNGTVVDVNEIITYEGMHNIPLTIYISGLAVFNMFSDKFGGPLRLNTGDSITIMKRENGSFIMLGYNKKEVASGTSTSRPSAPSTGQCFFDTTLGKPIWWNGTAWVDALGLPAVNDYVEVRHVVNGTEVKVISTDAESQGLTIYAPTEVGSEGYIVAQQGNTAAFVDPADIGLK